MEEIIKEVRDEIQKIGDNTKLNYDELQKSYDEVKKIISDNEKKTDVLLTEKLKKYTEEISVRQEMLDKTIAENQEKIDKKTEESQKKLDDRMDGIEVALKRSPESQKSPEEEKELKRMAKEFTIHSMIVKDKTDKGATFDRVNSIDVDVKGYQQYVKSFESFLRKDDRLIAPEDLKALSVGIDPDGGYTVTPAMSKTILKRLFEADPLRQLATVEKISTGSLDILVDWGDAGWGWEAETVAGDETTTPKMYKKRIPTHVMFAKPHASQTQLEDSGINVPMWLSNKVSNSFIRGEGAAFVLGNGVGKPRGFLSYANGLNFGQIERVAMKNAATLTADGFIALKYSLIEQYLSRGTWLMNRLTVADTMYLKNGAGDYIWKPGLTEDKNSTLLGLPVRMSTSMPVVAANSLPVVLADWSEAYLIVDRLGITMQRDPFTEKPNVEFYTRKRVGGDVTNFQAVKIGIIST